MRDPVDTTTLTRRAHPYRQTQPLPDFMVIGAEKSGSTFLEQCLRQHPDIYLPPSAGVHFLADPLYTGNFDALNALFVASPPAKIKGIRRMRYLREPRAAPFIHTNFPDACLLAILRHPVARVISAYFQAMWLDWMPIEPLNHGLPKVLNGAYDDTPAHRLIIQDGFYYTNLSRYLDYFARGQFRVLLLDDFKTDPAQQMREVYRFVGVADDFTPNSLSQKENKGIYSMLRVRWRRAYRRLMYRRSPDGTRVTLLDQSFSQRTLSTFLRRMDHYVLAPLLQQPRPPLSPVLAQQLLELYRPEVKQLETLLNRRLEAWQVW